MYRKIIIDELGEIKGYCSEMSYEEVEKALTDHPEWQIHYIYTPIN